MSLIPPFIFAFSVNIDAFLVGMSYGLRRQRITPLQNFFISFISFAGTLLSILSGSVILLFLPPLLTGLLGSAILLCLGIYYLVKSLLSYIGRLPLPQEASLRLPLSPKATLLLALSLSCNNIGIGIGASLGGISLFSTGLITFVTSVLFLAGGNLLGRSSFFCISSNGADLISGITLILLGLCNAVL